MYMKQITNQKELDALCKKGIKKDEEIEIVGEGLRFNSNLEVFGFLKISVKVDMDWGRHAELRESSHAVLWESSHAVLWGSSHAVLWGSSHAELWGSSHAELRESSHAVLRESSHAVLRESSHAVLWGSSHAVLRESSHAVLRESSHAVLWGSSHARASKYAVLHIHGKFAKAVGGVKIKVPVPTTAKDWCAFYGVTVKAGLAILFKAVRDDFRSAHGTLYAPGSTPKAEDWDGGKAECGGGLHFSFHPSAAKDFDSEATRFVACPVLLKNIKVYRSADYPGKIKAPQVDAALWDCGEDGKPIKHTRGNREKGTTR